jgi:hypothetical protein
MRSVAPNTPTPPLLAGDGTLAVTEFHVPSSFSCLAADPTRALITIGWNVPSANDVRLILDDHALPTGMDHPVPYQVPAGGAKGIGATIVFSCAGPSERTIGIEWTAADALAARRTASITRDASDG